MPLHAREPESGPSSDVDQEEAAESATPSGSRTSTGATMIARARREIAAALSSAAQIVRTPGRASGEATLLRVAEHVSDVYYETSTSGQLEQASAAYDRIWGRERDGARGMPWFHAVHDEDLSNAEQARLQLLAGEAFDVEYRIVRADGELRWIRDRALLSNERHPPRIIGVARDVTAYRRLLDELEALHQHETLGVLAASVAHDLGNLLQGIMGCLKVALNDDSSAARSREYTRHALNAVRGGATLVNRLTTLGRPSESSPQVLSLDRALFDCSALLQQLLGEHIQLDLDAQAPHALLLADPRQIEHLLMNLVANARAAMPAGGRLSIKTYEPSAERQLHPHAPSTVLLEVRDTGVGMDAETQLHMFDPFFTTKPIGEGVGLGMTTVRAVTRALGAQLEVHSQLGNGTCFVFHFPCTTQAPEDAPESARGRFGGRSLVVEDDWRVRLSLRQDLEALGFEVIEASDLAEAMTLIDETLSLLVVDVLLPRQVGSRIRELVKPRCPELKVLYISAHPAEYLLQHGLLEQSDTVLQKPFELQDLARQVTALGAAPLEA